MPTSPVYYSHFTLGNPKKSFFNSIIHTHFRLFTLSQKTNCYSLTYCPPWAASASSRRRRRRSVLYYSATLRDAQYCDLSVSVCLSVCPRALSLEPMDRSSRNFVCRSPVYVARPSFGGVIRYVLPVLWMTSRLAVLGRMAKCRCCTIVKRLPRVALGHLGGVWCLWMPCLLMKRSESRPTTIQQLLSLA